MDTYFTLESPAFKNNGEIPAQYTCEGENISPPLRWAGAPKGTKSFAIIVDDPDAPDPSAPQTVWVHWVVANIPSHVSSLPANFDTQGEQGQRGLNDFKTIGYRGPCPPVGRHHYHHKIYALDTVLPIKGKMTKLELEKLMSGHILAQADLVATYQRKAH